MPRLGLGSILGGTWCAIVIGSGCAAQPTDTPVRAIQSSGPVAFVCLGDPDGELSEMVHPIDDCTTTVETPDDYSVPHLYALATQPNTGEVAVIDLSTDTNPLVDANPSVPGPGFLPVGAAPTAIVATAKSTATFVASAQPRYEGIYGLPSNLVRGASPRLTSWPACALPAAPEAMVLVEDPAAPDGSIRPACDAAYGDDEVDAGCEGVAHCHGDLATETAAGGRLKLVVTLPSEGGIAVIDAQDLLDREAGTRDPCVVERWLPLAADVPPPPTPEPAPASGACVPEPTIEPSGATYQPIPAGIALGGDQLYVSDRGAPVIHRLDLSDPCDPRELPALGTASAEDPERTATTRSVAVSPLTLDLHRYLYAIDDIDGSIMVYDVSDTGGSAQPLSRPHPEYNPFQPRDRVRLGSPPREIVIVQHLADDANDTTGATTPVYCDPDPNASGPATDYRTADDFESGAAPGKLRGIFALAVLMSGDMVVIDVDDYDAACRGPTRQNELYGCSDPVSGTLASSGEFSCLVSEPHQVRAGTFLISRDGITDREPGLAAFPTLNDADGTLIDPEDPGSPRMLATTPTTGVTDFRIRVGSETRVLDPASGYLQTANGDDDLSEHTLAMNLEDPRAQLVDQNWTVTYEGALPGFRDHFAELVNNQDGTFTLRDVTSAFCHRGVQSQNAIAATLTDQGLDTAPAAALADYVQIFSEPPVSTDSYWDQSACTYSDCSSLFGNRETPREARDLRIVEAYDDRLELTSRGALPDDDTLKCCFPGVVEFRVRSGAQWTVIGDQLGFLHHMDVAEDGTCRPSCSPDSERLEGRVRPAPGTEAVTDDDPFAFKNPFFRFTIDAQPSTRDMQFNFSTKSRFEPLLLHVVPDDELDVQPTAATYLRVTGELVVSDGSLQGLTFIDLSNLAITRQYN
ncbi:MAG: hypothetical protein KC731_11115 [Myxococcales bacterium]|nr:hypothetical protein [Myxococcales bacterium]